MSKKTVAIISYKRAIRSAKAIQKDKALQSEEADRFIAAIGPYLTKKDVVRKNLSAKRRKEFNTLVSEYKNKQYATKRARAEGIRKQTSTGMERGTWSDRYERARIVNAFKNQTVSMAIKEGYLDSWQVVNLRKTFDKLTPKKLAEAIDKAKERRRNFIPSEAQGYAAQNDADSIPTYLIEDIIENDLNIPRNLGDAEEIPFD